MNRAEKECMDRYNNERKSTPLLAATAPAGSHLPVFFWDHFLSCDGYQPVWRGAGGQVAIQALRSQLEAWLEVTTALAGPFDDCLFF